MVKKVKKRSLPFAPFALLFLLAGLGIGLLVRGSQTVLLEEDLRAIPHLLQFDERWKDERYGTSDIKTAGCAPTCLAMVFSFLKQDPAITPVSVARFSESNGHYVDGVGTSHSLFEDAASHFHVSMEGLFPVEPSIDEALQSGKPVIASMVPGHFTQTGHFIVLTGEQDGQYSVLDPNSNERSTGWDKQIVLDEMMTAWGFGN